MKNSGYHQLNISEQVMLDKKEVYIPNLGYF